MFEKNNLNNALIKLVLALLLVGGSCRQKAFNIPTPSMEATLPVGTKVWLTYGSVTRNDIVVYRYPPEPTTLYAHRMVAQPGDQFRIVEGEVSINRRKQKPPDSVQYMYQVIAETPIDQTQFEKLGIWDFNLTLGGYIIHATPSRATKLEQANFVTSVTRKLDEPGREDAYLHEDFKGWNKDHFGPLLVPKANDIISGEQLKHYSNLILTQEGEDIQNLESYQFKKSYCFVMGDNRDNALDSRFTGLIPMENVLGSAKKLF